MNKKITQDEIISKAIKIHGEKLSFEKSVYQNMTTKMCVTCPIHGDFWIKPTDLIYSKHGCKYCSHQSYPSSIDVFKEKCNAIYDSKYDYNKSVYTNNKTKLEVICPLHGSFWTRPDNHLHGHGCPKCGKISMVNKQSLGKDKFIKLSKLIHGDKYNYSKVEYVDYETKVCIICPKHGEFWQTPDNHLHGHGCPNCKSSKLEETVNKLLLENNIEFTRQQTYPWLKYKGNLFLDFYLPKYNIAIECQGLQHYEPRDFFGGEKDFKERVARDNIKLALCEKNGIRIIYYSNNKINGVINNEEKLLKIINEHENTNNIRRSRS